MRLRARTYVLLALSLASASGACSSATTNRCKDPSKTPASNCTEDVPAPEVTAAPDAAPVPGAITFEGVGATALTVKWGAATDDTTAPADLQYKVVRADGLEALDTLDKVNALPTTSTVADFTANLGFETLTGLTAATTYAFAVVVRDKAGNLALYAPASQKTLASGTP